MHFSTKGHLGCFFLFVFAITNTVKEQVNRQVNCFQHVFRGPQDTRKY